MSDPFSDARKIVAFAILLVAGTPQAFAATWDRFDGAWVMEGESCDKVFTMKNGKAAFSKRQGTDLPGFIVQGGQIRGLTSQCSVASRKENGDTMKLRLHCRSQIMFGDMTVSVKIKDDDTIARIDPDFPEMETTYSRCK